MALAERTVQRPRMAIPEVVAGSTVLVPDVPVLRRQYEDALRYFARTPAPLLYGPQSDIDKHAEVMGGLMSAKEILWRSEIKR